MSDPTASANAAKPRRRRAWRWLLGVVLVLVALPFVLVFGLWVARHYFDDERLRGLIERQGSALLGAPVTLDKLELRLFHEVTIEGLVIGPPTGFTRDVLRLDYAHVSWVIPSLSNVEVIVPDMTARGIGVVYEQNEHGTNVEAIQKRFQTAPADAEAPSQPTTESTPLEQPDLPMRVALQHLEVSQFRAEVVSPEQQASIDAMGMAGSFDGYHRAIALELWMGVGDRVGEGRSSAKVVQPGLDVASTQRGGVLVRSSGFGDVGIEVDFSASTDVRAPYALPRLDTRAAAKLAVNLIEQKATLTDAIVGLGKKTQAQLGLHATNILGTPTVEVDQASGSADLHELEPFVAAFMPGTTMRGTVSFAADPTVVVTEVNAVTTGLSAQASNVSVHALDYDATDVDATMKLALASGIASMSATMHVARAVAPQGAVDDTRASLELSAPVSGEGPLTAFAEMRIANAEGSGAAASGMTMSAKVDSPIELLMAKPGATGTLHTKAELHIDRAGMQRNLAKDITMSADVRQRDLAANDCDVQLDGAVGAMSSALPEGVVTLPRSTMTMKVLRRGQTVDIPTFEMTLGDITRLTASTRVERALTAAPRVQHFTADVPSTRIEPLLALVPSSMLPPASIGGSFASHATFSGTVPYVELGAAAAPPVIPNTGDPWGASIAAYAAYAKTWATRLEKGLPFSGTLTFDLDDVAYTDASSDVSGVRLNAKADITRHGPTFACALDIAAVNRPQRMHDVHGEWYASLIGTQAETHALGLVGSVEQEGFAVPLEATAFEAAASYTLGGDARIDKFSFAIPGTGTRFEAMGILENPIDVAIARSWEQPGIPGVALDASYELRVANKAPVNYGSAPESAMTVAGEMSSRGSFVIKQGAASFIGDFRANELTASFGSNGIEGLTGALPYDIRVAFDERAGSTPVVRDLAFAGGTVSLITGTNESAESARPAYYDRLRDYQANHGVTARRATSGPYVVENMRFDGGLANGRLRLDTMTMHLLGGDVIGNMDFRITATRDLVGEMDMKVSNIDASTFSMLQLTPGPDSEMNADAHMTFAFGPHTRDLAFNMNVTKIGSKTLDRFLQLLDPEQQNDSLQRTRGQLKFVSIDNVAMWVRYENLNMDIDVTTFLRIPFTNIGFPNIDRELLRRYSISEQLDFYLQPTIDTMIAPALGWNRAQ